MNYILQPWPWYVSGSLIALLMLLMHYFGKSFGVSSNFRHFCAMCGAGKLSDFFRYDWKSYKWNLLFIGGSIIGGAIAHFLLSEPSPVAISASTIQDLSALGFAAPEGMQPSELFGPDGWSAYNLILLSAGGLLIGFGTRYASGCTSGHAISGLSNLQLPSLLAVIGFFAGGLIMTHFIFPVLF